jgi:hypothetical protein
MIRPADTGAITVNISASDRMEFNASQELIRTTLRMAKDWQAIDMVSDDYNV